jgi:membrane protein involved in colicin uptake
MKTSNPFQIPSCLQRANLQQRRQERFKQAVVVSIAALAALLVILLIQGCVSEHAQAEATAKTTAAPRP